MVIPSLILALSLAPQISIRVEASGNSDSVKAARRERNRVRLTPSLLATAFADEGARALLERARITRLRHDSTLTSYDARTYQRLSVGMGIGTLARERLAFRTENAARVRWRRDIGAVIDVRGSRTAIPIAGRGIRVESGDAHQELAVELAPIPYFPGKETLWGTGSLARAEVDIQELINPLALGAEAYYVYATGDSVRFRFPDGRRIQLRELTVRPREPAWNTVIASLWFDTGSGHLVRAAYRFSAPFKVWDAIVADGDQEDVPLFVRPVLTTAGFDLTSVMVEYALQENRWWLPRAQILEGRANAVGLRLPIRIEERYSYAHVNGTLDSLPASPQQQLLEDSLWRDSSRTLRRDLDSLRRAARRDSITRVALRPLIDSLDAALDSMRVRRDSVRARRRRAECAESGSYVVRKQRYESNIPVTATVPCDTSVLARSSDLPPSIYEDGEEIMNGASRAELARALGLGAQAGWAPQPVTLLYGPMRGLLRYNRIEGLSAGVGAEQQLGGGYKWDATAQIGIADRQPNAEAGLARTNGRLTLRVAAYRRLVPVSDWGAPLGIGNSLSALLFSRDDGFYHRALGAELGGQQSWHGSLAWRVFGERHDEAKVGTQFSLANAINDVRFPDNVPARGGIWAGGATRWRSGLGLDPAHFRVISDARVEAAGGQSSYGRAALDLTLTRALGPRYSFALSGAAGGSAGDLPPQRFWLLGGAHTVRGQRPGTMAGDAFWLGRAELGLGQAGFRPTVFGDLGWAGARESWRHPGVPMSGVGLGLSVLDGLVRFDIARGVRPERGVRAEFYLDANF